MYVHVLCIECGLVSSKIGKIKTLTLLPLEDRAKTRSRSDLDQRPGKHPEKIGQKIGSWLKSKIGETEFGPDLGDPRTLLITVCEAYTFEV